LLEDVRQLEQGGERDLRRSEVHRGADPRLDHPGREFSRVPVWRFHVEEFLPSHAHAAPDAQPPPVERMPAIRDLELI
jgi:hypothetical protein